MLVSVAGSTGDHHVSDAALAALTLQGCLGDAKQLGSIGFRQQLWQAGRISHAVRHSNKKDWRFVRRVSHHSSQAATADVTSFAGMPNAASIAEASSSRTDQRPSGPSSAGISPLTAAVQIRR
jgi:hypothetical protein